MSYNKFKISVEVKNAKLLAATKKVASLLRESFKWNPDFPEAYVNRGRSTGELIVGGISRELLENDLRKTTEKIRLQKSSSKWHLKCIITELAAVATEKSPEAESPPRLDKEIPLHEGHLQVSQQGAYKLLLTSDAMEGLSAIGEKSKVTFSSVLHDLAQGKWETWEKGSCSGFSSWKEDKGSQELFTFFDPVSKQLIIWGRAWSIDLFGQVSYPKGTYYQKSPPPDKYSLHIVLYAIKEMDSPPSSEFFYEGINYVEEEGLNNGVTIRSMTPEDQIRYSEELFLLSRSRINDLLEGTQRGLPLHMSEEQVIALQPGGPLLVSGEAGSGKTIIITQWLVMNHLQSSSNHERGRESINQLFVTFSKRLRDKAMEDFERMLPLAFRDHETRFITNRDLVKEILTESGLSGQFTGDSEMNFERFMKEYARNVPPEIDPALLWDEIRSTIKGSTYADSTPLISRQKYLDLPKGYSETPRKIREVYFDAAKKYQDHLLDNGLWDELDVVQACLSHIEKAKQYDKIACDEVQDLAPIEIVLLIKLLKDNDIRNIFLTGDRAQVINPSGFTWRRTKKILGEQSASHPVPDRIRLDRNYRSCLEIVELANAVLYVRGQVLNDPASKLNQVPLIPSNIKPTVLNESPIAWLNEIQTKPRQRLILVKRASEKAVLKRILGERVANQHTILTIEEAKGLEFDGVLMWNFFIPRHESLTKNDWKKVFVEKKREKLIRDITARQINPYGLAYEFNLLHVGLTRAKRVLFVYDDNELLNLTNLGKEIHAFITEGTKDDFLTSWRTGSANGDDLFEAGNNLLEKDTEQANSFFKLASEAYNNEGQYEKAAISLEHASEFDGAARIYKAMKNREKELWAEMRYNEVHGNYENAGSLSVQLATFVKEKGELGLATDYFDRAQKHFLKAGNDKLAADTAWNAASCAPEQTEKAKRFNRASFFLRKISIEEAIKAKERAITETKIVRDGGSDIIEGIRIEDWIAKRYREIATLFEDNGQQRQSVGALTKAINLWRALMQYENNRMEQSLYCIPFIDTLYDLVEKTARLGDIERSREIRCELLKNLQNFERTSARTNEIDRKWNTYMALYIDLDEFEEYTDVVLELASYLGNSQNPDRATKVLQREAESCRERSLSTIELTLLEERVHHAKIHGDANEKAAAHREYARTCRKLEDHQTAGRHFQEAAMHLLTIGDMKKANDNFRLGMKQLRIALNPTELGWYCFDNVALSGYLEPSRRNNVYVLNWTREAITAFIQDYERSRDKLRKQHTILDKDYKRRVRSSLVDGKTPKGSGRQEELELIRLKRGWIELALGLLYQENALKTGENKPHKDAIKWIEMSNSTFVDAGDPSAIALTKRVLKKVKSKG